MEDTRVASRVRRLEHIARMHQLVREGIAHLVLSADGTPWVVPVQRRSDTALACAERKLLLVDEAPGLRVGAPSDCR